MRSPVCDLLGIEFPIVAFSHCRDVVAAVSRAGGIGVFGAAKATAAELDIELKRLDEEVAGRPYGVDVVLPRRGAGAEAATAFAIPGGAQLPAEQVRFLEDLLARYEIPPLPPGERRQPLGERLGIEGALELVEVALQHRVGLFGFALGQPPADLVAQAHSRGIPIAALVGTTKQALRQVEAGVDIVVAQGTEAGGHCGEISTMVLVPEVVDAVAPVPVLAAGGIARGRQIAAAMALGAQGVWTGSVWLTTTEADTHPVVMEKLLEATSAQTVRSRSLSGKPLRQLETDWTQQWEGPDSPGPLPMPLQVLLTEEARTRIERSALAGNPKARALLPHTVGQVVGIMNSVRPAARVLQEMIEEYLEVAERFAAAVEGA